MSKVILKKVIKKDISSLWKELSDVGAIHKFYALLDSSPVRDQKNEGGAGTERVCNFHDGNWIKERVTHFEENKRLSVEVYDGSMPLKSCEVHFLLNKTSNLEVELTIHAEYELKFGLIGRFLDIAIVNRQFHKNLTLMIEGFNEYVTTGKSIPKGWRPELQTN